MFGQVILLLASSVFAIKCNNAITPSALPITILDSTTFDATTPPTSYSCVSFKFTCSLSNPACTAPQQQNREVLSGYTMVASKSCSKLSSNISSIIGAPVCCTTDLCNTVVGSTGTNTIVSAPITNNTAVGSVSGKTAGASSISSHAGVLAVVAIVASLL